MFPRGRHLVAGSVVAVALTLGGAALSGVPDRLVGRGSSGAAALPDTFLLIGSPTNMGPQPALVGVASFRPETGSFVKLLDTLQAPVPAPDNRDLFFVQDRLVDDQQRTAIVDLASDTLRPRWSADVLTLSMAEVRAQTNPPVVRLAATRDRLYVAIHRWQSPEPITLLALDRVDGFVRSRWQSDVADLSLGPLQLRIVDKQLYLLAVDTGAGGRSRPPPPNQQLLLFRFRLPDGLEDAHAVPVRTSGLPWPAQPTPDGRGLYSLGGGSSSQSVALHILDLAAASVERLELPFVARGNDWVPHEQGPSADGRQLFVFAPTLGQLVSVDMVNRRVGQLVPIDVGASASLPPTLRALLWGALGGLFVQAAEARSPFVGALQASPDATRLYAIGLATGTREYRGAGVLVIDSHQWRVLTRWLPRVEPSQILLSADGRQLLVQESPWSAAPTAGAVHVLDTSTGSELFASDPLQRAELHSVAELYRATYGSGSSAHGARAQSELVPLASLTVAAHPAVAVAGRPVQIEARFVDPRTGQTVRSDAPGVRFDPPTTVTARLVRNRTDDRELAVPLQLSDFGVYTGAVQMPAESPSVFGSWTLRADANWPDGLRRVELPDAVLVRPTFAGTDARAYALELITEGAQPRVDQDVQLRVAFVDADTGAALPAGVGLAEGLPNRLEIACYGQGVTARDLDAIDHGIYAGTVRLWAPGTWRVQATFVRADGTSASFVAGSVRLES